jgi:outer membrane protein OmpA-like peptidoglycan-associated protein
LFAAWAGAQTRLPGDVFMSSTACAKGAFARRFLCLAASVAFAGLVLTGCASDDQATGSAFTQALAKNYGDLSNQAAALPVPPDADEGFFDSIFNIFGSSNPNDDLAKAFQEKADTADGGSEPEPDAALPDPSSEAIRTRLVRDLAAGKEQFPAQAARAQADFDCWVMASAVPSALAMGQACRTSLDGSLAALEGNARPAPAPVLMAPPPAPVQSAPIPAPAPAPAPVPSAFTVYFDFDSWTLTAEDLKVITDVINTARTGGQAHIVIVGHTDTSGSADYNQKLSVRRANVVVEALVDLGARRAAITATGVGKSDLAVETGDNVKEAKNRRAVVSLQP